MAERVNFLSSGLFRVCLYQRGYKCLITVTLDLQRLGEMELLRQHTLGGYQNVWNGAVGVAKKNQKTLTRAIAGRLKVP